MRSGTQSALRIENRRNKSTGIRLLSFALGKLYKITKFRNYLTDDRKIQTQKTLNPTDDRKIEHKKTINLRKEKNS